MASAIVIIGGGPAGRAAAEILPGATLIARPALTAWHAEPGLVWTEGTHGVEPVPFERLLLCADEPLLLAALGAAFEGQRPRVDTTGATSLPGIYAAGVILGAATREEAAAQGRIAARALAGQPPGGRIQIRPLPPAPALRPGPAALLAASGTPAASEAERRRLALPVGLCPARSVSLAALAELAGDMPAPAPLQEDVERLA